tara:strand:- start:240 stop:416 length:177 start_codon:yes stop_codon:yes gene_type:complete
MSFSRYSVNSYSGCEPKTVFFDSLLDADLASFGALTHALLDLEVRGLVSCQGGRYTIA